MSRWDRFAPQHTAGDPDDDDYRIVTVKVTFVRTAAFEIVTKQGKAWVPRSLIHAADDQKLDGLAPLTTITIRLRAWKAEALGLA